MNETGTELSLSTTSTNDNKYKYARSSTDKRLVLPRESAERNKTNRKENLNWSNDRLKDELSSLIAEFSYLTDVSAKTSKEKNPMTVLPPYHVYAADITPVDKGPFRMSSRSSYPGERNDNLMSEKTVEWEDNVKRKRSSHRHSPKKYKENSNRNRKDDFVPSKHDKTFRKSRSKRTKGRLNNKNSNMSLRSQSRSKSKSPKRRSQIKLNRSQRSRQRLENKSHINRFRISSSDRAVKRPRKSRSKREHRRKQSRSISNVKLVKKRSLIKKLRASSYDRLENGVIRRKKVRSKSQVVEKQYIPIRYKKRSKSFSKGFYPFRYEGRKEKRTIIKRRKSIPLIRKYEVKDSIPSEAATVLTIYPRLDPRYLETKLEPEFLTDQTLPCKCFQCMRKYKSIVNEPKVQSPFRSKGPKVHTCMCDGHHQIMEGYQNMPHPTGNHINMKKLPKHPWRNMTCDFGKCAMPVSRNPQQEVIKRYFQEIPYPHHDSIAGGFCHDPLTCFSSESESGYITGQSVKSVYFKFNRYTHHIDSTITQYFHSILGQNNFY